MLLVVSKKSEIDKFRLKSLVVILTTINNELMTKII